MQVFGTSTSLQCISKIVCLFVFLFFWEGYRASDQTLNRIFCFNSSFMSEKKEFVTISVTN